MVLVGELAVEVAVCEFVLGCQILWLVHPLVLVLVLVMALGSLLEMVLLVLEWVMLVLLEVLPEELQLLKGCI